MPFVDLRTNATPSEAVVARLLRDLSEITAKHLKKSSEITMSGVSAGEALSFRGNLEPAAFLEVRSIGLPDRLARGAIAAELTELLDDVLDIPADRVFIVFRDVPRDQWGVSGAMLA